jgi:hypothetical protein
VKQSVYQINVQSHGARDQKSLISIWTSNIDYFEQTRIIIDTALYEYFRATQFFPRDDETFDKALTGSKIQFRQLMDPWGRPYYVRYTYESDFADTVRINYNPESRIQETSLVTRKLAWIRIYSSGPDGQPSTADDFQLAGFSHDISEQSGKDLSPQSVANEPLSGFSGAIKGTIVDPSRLRVPNVSVVASSHQTRQTFTTLSNSSGDYVIRSLPPGIYDVSFSSPGFKTALVCDVPVHSTSMTTVNTILDLSTINELMAVTSTVDAHPATMETTAATITTIKTFDGTKKQIHEEMFTPRLRDYFPETLFWAPSIITDATGRARIKFKLADNITSWKMTVLASTKSGEIGVAEKEIEAFQPFFLDHDPPKVLTVGDSIDLPVVVRNYLPQTQKLDIEMKPAPWFSLENPGKLSISVAAGESKPVVFPLKATDMVKSGKQQVYAANRTTGDAIEKTIRVHPDGIEQNSSVSAILGHDETFLLRIPDDAIPGSLEAHLKIYHNLFAHVIENIEAGLERPYGCGEQTISSTYPSVMLLKYYKASGKANAPLKYKAERYAKLGYQRMLNYRDPGGGFGYWGHGNPDIALTAYAIRFLYDASAITEIDPQIISDAWKWLVSKQEKDGAWHPAYGQEYSALTAYVAVTIAQAKKYSKDPSVNALHEAVVRALDYLSDPHRPLDDPYSLAEFAIAAKESGDNQKAQAAVEKLSKRALEERNGFYWAIEGNTPFYGWGRAGRIESTAMAVLALSNIQSSSRELQKLIDGGVNWLIQQKDGYGAWHSSQATITVLTAILSRIASTGTIASNAPITLWVNDQSVEVKNAELQSDAPMFLDISRYVKSGDNKIRIQSSRSSSDASIQAVADYYVPWTGASAQEMIRPGAASALRLAARFDKTEAKVGDPINCTVEAERIGNRGWGMMIAEVGLPPGADVDRRILDEAVTKSGWTVSRYDVLPDRLVLYLWPHAGGVQFTFAFKARYGLKARTAPSKLYDYYNPDARVSLPSTNFIIR